jgi:hypothetical protein
MTSVDVSEVMKNLTATVNCEIFIESGPDLTLLRTDGYCYHQLYADTVGNTEIGKNQKYNEITIYLFIIYTF